MRPLTEASAHGDGVWPPVPREVAEVLRPELDRATEEVIGAIQREVPEYARPHDDQYAAVVRRAVHEAVHQFVQRIADPATSRATTADLFAGIGRIEAAEGRSLESLQAALRLGARVTWRTLCQQAVRGSLSVDVIGPVGEALFLYIDELAAACAEGFARASAEVAGELERRRRRLLDLIVTEPPVSREAITDLARAAGWAVPRKVAVVVLVDRSQDHFGPLPALPPDVLVDMTRQDPCLLVPDPDGPGRADMIERGLRGWTGALGPVVPLSRAGCSLRWARQVLALTRRGAIRAGCGLIHCEEHLTSLLLLSDEELARVLSSVWLAPLSRLRPSQQDIIAETLLAWLQNAGNARLAASQLHVHPQTVRYRLRQIQELFGDALAGPAARFDLEAALRARQLLRGAAGASAGPGGAAPGRNGARREEPGTSRPQPLPAGGLRR